MFPDPHFPWSFRRDEVDLLEEDIDDLYDLHQSTSGRIQTMEQAIISEQLDTEEQADAEFTIRMDMRVFVNREGQKGGKGASVGVPLVSTHEEEDDLSCDASRPPFYEQLFQFADRVFVFASEAYARKDAEREHAFRVQINVKMVPIKCANALSDELHHDLVSLELAKKEYTLALVYLERILVSLAFMATEDHPEAQTFLAPGMQFKKTLIQHLTRLDRDRRGF